MVNESFVNMVLGYGKIESPDKQEIPTRLERNLMGKSSLRRSKTA